VEQKTLLCPFCEEKITSKFTICRHCGQIVLGSKASRKRYFFLAVCLILIILSVIFKCLVK
jgi:predicted nucleic acid-binding Zn ribbon protein